MCEKIVALIPVREGSKRVKNKNFRRFSDQESLLRLKIKQLIKQNCFDKIYVSSDSEKAKKVAEEEGVTFLYRDPYMTGHKSRLYEYNNYMLKSIPGNPIVAWTMVTAPLFENYNLAVEKYLSLDKIKYDSLVSVIKYNDFLIDENGKPINCAFGHWHLLTQELRKSYQITGSIYIASKKDQLEWSYWIGLKPYLYEISKYESIDVDDMEDFRLAEILYKNKPAKNNVNQH
ncbi:MAG: hypothetical protein KAT68_16120 [Bacteroidales bacterium]|nr:hypothetical protein [Bacteroidales bacterium]